MTPVATGAHLSPTLFDRWLDEYIPIDPLLKEPFDLAGNTARRRTMAKVLLEQFGLDHRLHGGTIRPSTYEVLFDMLDPLADSRLEGRFHLPTRSRAVCGDPRLGRYPNVERTRAAGALMDFGWGHNVVPGGEIRDVLSHMQAIYIEQVSKRVLTMFRKWEREGWVVDSDHQQN